MGVEQNKLVKLNYCGHNLLSVDIVYVMSLW